METFKLFHVLLYAKHWYKRFNHSKNSNNKTIFDDLRKCFTSDGYMGEDMRVTDIIALLLINCQRIKIPAFNDLRLFAEGIRDCEVWKNGYYTKTNDTWNPDRIKDNPDYDYQTAIAYYCLSNLCVTEIKQFGVDKLPKPDYKNCLPRRKGITNEKVNEVFI